MSEERQSPKRRAILDAATAAFRDEGYEATSMDRIAEWAGVSKRTIYNHFGSKEVLFRAVVDQLIVHTKSLKCVDWDAERSLEDQLADFVRAKLVVATDPAWSGLLRVVLGVFIHNPALVGETTLRTAHGEDSLVRWLEAAHAAGRMKVDVPSLAGTIFWAMVTGALFWPRVFGLPMTEAETELITAELIETFLSRYRA
ncbi:MAG: TetR/AcrR family transcriptional regulator [Proteobacteria bacterium]|nr:TetR/AcrR family transcriptional regulator [Pseudomonadota bacterium]